MAPAHSASAAPTSPGATTAGAATAKVALDVTITSLTGTAVHYTLYCDPAGGTTPDPEAACTKLMTGADIFAPLPPHVMCAMVDSQSRATITGTYLGKNVHLTVVDGGCYLSRWAKLKSIFG